MTELSRVSATRRHGRTPAGTSATATHMKRLSSDQAPGEETVQVNDKYVGGGPPPKNNPAEHIQHQTGG